MAKAKQEVDVAVQIVRALSRVWDAIRDTHDEVPPVVLLPGSGNGGGIAGHFAPLRWTPTSGEQLHEVVVVAEHLNRKPEDVVETLIHEAAHAMNFVRGISDCTASQYHNRKFKRAAEELGLRVEQIDNYGFAETSLLPETRRHYDAEIRRLGAALASRVSHPPGTRGSRLLKATCRCGFIIRASAKVLATARIRCDGCGELFQSVRR